MNRKKPKTKTSSAEAIFVALEKGVGKFLDAIFRKSHFEVFSQAEASRIWEEIESLEPKLAVIEADKLVDTALRRSGLEGSSMAARLRRCEKLVSRSAYQGMWEAHKVRNELVHEVGGAFSSAAAAECLGKTKRFLVGLGVFKR